MNINNNKHSDNEAPHRAPLRYHEELKPFIDVIEEFYYECDIDVYRTAVSNPPTEFDITPKNHRFDGTQGKVLPFAYTQEDIDSMEVEEKKIEVGHHAISVHKTEAKEIKEAKRSAASFGKKHTEEETEDYKYNQRGSYVMKLHITPDMALVSRNFHPSTGHANVLLREGVTIDDLLVEEYEIKEFKYDDDNK